MWTRPSSLLNMWPQYTRCVNAPRSSLVPLEQTPQSSDSDEARRHGHRGQPWPPTEAEALRTTPEEIVRLSAVKTDSRASFFKLYLMKRECLSCGVHLRETKSYLVKIMRLIYVTPSSKHFEFLKVRCHLECFPNCFQRTANNNTWSGSIYGDVVGDTQVRIIFGGFSSTPSSMLLPSPHELAPQAETKSPLKERTRQLEWGSPEVNGRVCACLQSCMQSSNW